MFISPCSLRSTQCAALIALATAAGIARVEVAEARGESSRSTKPETNLATRVEVPRFGQTAPFQVAFDAIAPWLAFLQIAALGVADGESEVSAPLPAVTRATPLPFPSRLRCGPTARQHAYPFAVGPPPDVTQPTSRADDTSVSADSAARRTAVSRVVAVSLLSLSARLTRLGIPGPTLAGTFSSPSSALRGEPALLPRLSAPTKASGLSRRIPCDDPAETAGA